MHSRRFDRLNLFPRWLFVVILAVVLLAGAVPTVSAHEGEDPIRIYFFWGDGCPHCAEAEPFLEELELNVHGVEIRDYEVWNNDGNRDLARQMAAKFGFEASSVPIIFLDRYYWVGFNETIQAEIEAAVGLCEEQACVDAGAGVMPGAIETGGEGPLPADPQTGNLVLPGFGAVDLSTQSLAVSTLLIAFVDGFNPCSLWVLSMLLALVLHTGSRRKIFLIGGIFLTVTALIYALFIAGLFSVLQIVSFVGWIQVAVAMIALVFAVVNIKDYFWYKEGLSFTIADDKKPGLYKKMRNVLNSSGSIWGLVASTVALAVGVSLVEFSCTAGFPVLWTNILTAHDVSPLTFVGLLVLYMVVYQIDELIIFSTAVFTLKTSRMEEKHGRILKLVGGTLMLTLALVMLIDPDLLNNLSSSLIIFGMAFLLAAAILIIHRLILPGLGVNIGSERTGRRRKSERAK